MAKPKKLSGMAALLKVLTDNGGGPMKVTDVIDQALPLTDLKGKTPRQTLAARLYTSPANFKKTGRGLVALSNAAKKAAKEAGTLGAKPSRAKAAASNDGAAAVGDAA